MSENMKTMTVEIEAGKFDRLNELFEHGERSAAIRTYVDAVIEHGGYDKQTALDVETQRLAQKRPPTPPEELRALADRLAKTRQKGAYHPSIDGKLAEAEVNLRGVAGVLEDRSATEPDLEEF